MRVRNYLVERTYTLREDRDKPEKERTLWHIKGLPYDVQMALQSQMSPTVSLPASALGKGQGAWDKALESSNVQLNLSGGQASMQFDILNEGLIGFENLLDIETGKPVIDPNTGEPLVFPSGLKSVAKKKQFFAEWLPRDVRVELANAITEGSVLDEDESKN